MILPWQKMIGLQTNIPKAVAIVSKGQGVILMESNIRVSVLPKRMVILIVIVKATKLLTDLASNQDRKSSIKLLKVV